MTMPIIMPAVGVYIINALTIKKRSITDDKNDGEINEASRNLNFHYELGRPEDISRPIISILRILKSCQKITIVSILLYLMKLSNTTT